MLLRKLSVLKMQAVIAYCKWLFLIIKKFRTSTGLDALFAMHSMGTCTAKQQNTCCAVAKTSGSVLGVTIGCLLGMCPLLWMDAPQREVEKAHEELA